MASLLEQLDINSLLLMYLANELSSADRIEMEQRLASDPALAEELARLRQAQAVVESALLSGDAATPLPMSCDTAVRRVSRAMKQWQVDRLTRKAIAPQRAHFRLPIWSYASAVAAAIIVGMLIWANNLPDAGNAQLTPEQIAAQQKIVADELEQDLADAYTQEFDAQSRLAMRDLSASAEQDLDQVFMRQRSW